MVGLSYLPIALFALVALVCWGTRWGALGALLAASYCGVIMFGFTGGASGAIWLVQPLLLIAGVGMLWRGRLYASWPPPARWLIALFTVFGIGIIIGLARYDSSLLVAKGMNVDLVLGIPLPIAMAGYRTFILASLILAFVIPLKCPIDAATFRRLGLLCWWLTLMFSAASVLTYLDVLNLAFDYRSAVGYQNVAVLGFHRASAALIIITGALVSYAAAVKHALGPPKIIYYCGYGVIALGLLTTWSRAGLVCLAVALVVMVLAEGILRRPGPVFLMILVAAAVIAGLYLIPGMEGRFSLQRATSGAMDTRFRTWQNLIQWWIAHPIGFVFGVGFQNFHYEINISARAVRLGAAHNMYLHVLAEGGIAGLVLLLGWLGSTFRWLRRRCLEDHAYGLSSPAAPLLGLWVGLAVSGLSQESMVPSPSMIPFLLNFYLLFGIWVSHDMYQARARANAMLLNRQTQPPLAPRADVPLGAGR